MLPYQIRKYCENAIYAQNTVNPNINFATSWRCSIVMVCLKYPAERRTNTIRTHVVSEPRIPPTQKYTPKMVLNHVYWRLIRMSKAKKVAVRPSNTTPEGAHQCILRVSSAPPTASCS